MPYSAQRILLASRPVGWPSEDNFQLVDATLPDPGDGQIAIEVEYLSVDPYMRSRMRDTASYAAPVQVGELMTGAGLGRVIASNSPRYAVGDWVTGVTGWCSHLVTEARGFRKVDPALAPVSTSLGVLGNTGLTAYFGVLDVCQAKAGETMVVSGAAGAVGSVAGQIGRILGCRVVGTAGSDDKIAWITEELGFDGGFNYKAMDDYRQRLKELCPAGIDTYFDNTGGPLTDAVFPLLNLRARVAVCGQISQYNSEQPEMGPRLFWHLIVKRARVEGFLVIDYADRFKEGLAQLAAWLREGKIKYREEVEMGIGHTPKAFIEMMRGRNLGKMLVKVRP
ncbi:MAG: NADP-dependent oxidoreductase [Acidobacteria bacterium]|nr:NADP-dependent oxidoreductase [Acidobacteriota bacterium]